MNNVLVVAGVALIGVGTYLATLDAILGVVIVAIGTYVVHYGDRRESKADARRTDEKLSEIQRRIASAKEVASSPQEAQKLDSIGQEFREWAADFVRNKERNKLEVERTRIGKVESQLEKSEVWRPVLALFLETIRRSVEAYAAETGKPLTVSFPPLPTNLYDKNTAYTGIVDFGSKIRWTLELDRASDRRLMEFPAIWVRLHRGSKETPLAHLWSYAGDNTVNLTVASDALPLADMEGAFPMKDYRDRLRRAAQRLVEAQLLSS
jgi:hypothetical protein